MIQNKLFCTLVALCLFMLSGCKNFTTSSMNINITDPQSTISCAAEEPCQFSVSGTSSDVAANSSLRIYVAVFPVSPPGSGWYLQDLPASFDNKEKGTWSQKNVWIGDDSSPANPGDTLNVVALVMHKDTSSPSGPAKAYEDFETSAESNVISLTIE